MSKSQPAVLPPLCVTHPQIGALRKASFARAAVGNLLAIGRGIESHDVERPIGQAAGFTGCYVDAVQMDFTLQRESDSVDLVG